MPELIKENQMTSSPSDEAENKLTPMMAQWASCKAEAKEALLLFRMGDFYEAFHEDAAIVSRELDLILTQRQSIPMSGLPWHSAESYIDRLVEKGYKVAIAEQIEDPKMAKGLVKRKVVRILTRGTLISSSLLSEKKNNYIIALTQVGKVYGLSLADLTTAELKVTEIEKEEELILELFRLAPKECLTTAALQERFSDSLPTDKVSIVLKEPGFFNLKEAQENLLSHFKLQSLDCFGLKGKSAALVATGALFTYLKEELNFPLSHLHKIIPYSPHAFLGIDSTTARHLDLVESQSGQNSKTLLALLDYTLTPMGGRLLASWVKRPLTSPDEIKKRQEAISSLLKTQGLKNGLTDSLKKIGDLERLMMRIELKLASPKDLISLKKSIEAIQPIKEALRSTNEGLLFEANEKLSSFVGLTDLLSRALREEVPLKLGDGDLFRSGYHLRIDELTELMHGGKKWLLQYQAKLQEETGIKTLKVSFNRVFGYYLEVSRGQVKFVPASFERKQTLANCERFTTKELKQFETQLLLAEEQKKELEKELFVTLLSQVGQESQQIFQSAESIALIDVLASLAEVAWRGDFCIPTVDDSQKLEIRAGRHPILEKVISREHLIPNDVSFDEKKRLLLITGPNMAGKSTYLRQVALLVVMAQMGSFVPAQSMHLGIIDKIFSRIGASDDLLRGQSTFMTEMSETANILNNTTARSLVLLDEIGRGTSTYDGLAIAWSVTEYLLRLRSKTLFATHYFELTKLEERYSEVTNLHALVKEIEGEVLFLYKIGKGRASRSYGIQVAKLAGLPLPVIYRAKEILLILEEKKAKAIRENRGETHEQLFLAF